MADDSFGVVNVIRALHISEGALLRISSFIDESEGFEVCGFLLGSLLDRHVVVNNVWPAVNLYRARDRFAISHQEYLAVLRQESTAQDVIGIYHSHRGSARPSLVDRENIRLRSLLWLIIGIPPQTGTQSYDWKCFRCVGGKINEVPVSIRYPVARSVFLPVGIDYWTIP